MYNDQEKEIATIKERTLTLKLSDADCERISNYAGKADMSVSELIEEFIGDLVDGTYTHGSDERDAADQWYDRCMFEDFAKDTLLHHLLEWGYDPEDYIDALENIADAEVYKKKAGEHPENPENYENYDEEELSYIDGDIADWNEKLKDMREYWKPTNEPNMDAEIKKIKKWIKEREELKAGIPQKKKKVHAR